MNSVFFRLINTKNIFFSFLAAGYCPKNLAFARKIMALPDSGRGRLQPPAPSSYAYGKYRTHQNVDNKSRDVWLHVGRTNLTDQPTTLVRSMSTAKRSFTKRCLYTVSQKKLCQLIFCSLSVKYEPISIKIGRSVPEETFNETVPKLPISPKVCACTTLGNLKCRIEPSTQ